LQSDWLGAEVDSSARFVINYMQSMQRWIEQKWGSYGVLHVLGVESNLGRESSWIEGAIENAEMHNVKVLREAWTPQDKAYRSGVCTTNAVKQAAVQIMEIVMTKDVLSIEERGFFGENDEFVTELETQMKGWRKVPLATRVPGAAEKYAYTGKAGPDNKQCSKLRDDLIMSLLLNLYWVKVFLSGKLKNFQYQI
jgi:hypothetical protein